MTLATLARSDLSELAAAVRERGRFFGPRLADGATSLAEIGPQDEMALGFSNVIVPPKVLFFPQCETIGRCEGERMVGVPPPNEALVLFGVRPCDARAFLCLDKVFLDPQCIDPYYAARRERSLVICLACNTPCETCFCTSVGGSPDSREGADVLVRDRGEILHFESVTDEGDAFLATYADLFDSDVQPVEVSEAPEGAEEAKPCVDTTGIDGKMNALFDSPLWEATAERCLSCGACTFLCPTCQCFAIHDQGDGDGAERIRTHDSCQFALFTREASGHNPRGSTGSRLRQRMLHKFCYTVERYGVLSCVGCGRCVRVCPVNIDVRETVAEVAR